jgi:hypothetical protein
LRETPAKPPIRFRPTLPWGRGTSQHHWILDTAGAYLVAALLDVDRADLRWSHHAAATIADSQNLQHTHAVNEFATRLAEDLRATGGTLRQWHSERTVRHILGEAVVPDAHLVLQPASRPALHVLLEIDRGTEDHRRLLEKSRSYADAIPHSPLDHHQPLVLLLVPSARRARAVATTLANGPWPVVIDTWAASSSESPLAIIERAYREQIVVTQPSRRRVRPDLRLEIVADEWCRQTAPETRSRAERSPP